MDEEIDVLKLPDIYLKMDEAVDQGRLTAKDLATWILHEPQWFIAGMHTEQLEDLRESIEEFISLEVK